MNHPNDGINRRSKAGFPPLAVREFLFSAQYAIAIMVFSIVIKMTLRFSRDANEEVWCFRDGGNLYTEAWIILAGLIVIMAVLDKLRLDQVEPDRKKGRIAGLTTFAALIWGIWNAFVCGS